MADARIVAYAAATPPTDWLACDGASLLRADYADLFAAIGTTYGAADGTHFNVPDLRIRFALGQAASGTGSTLGGAGGALGHTHTDTHGHAVTQPSAHADHVVTQPGAHTSLTHSGFGADDHTARSHTGMSLANHTVTESANHGTHATAGSHQHDTHATTSVQRGSGSTVLLDHSGKHTSGGSHDHNAHSAHTESVSVHSITSQGADHPAQSHTVTQSSAHTVSAHAFTVDSHGAHTGAAAVDATVTTGDGNPPYLALLFIIAPTPTPLPVGAVVEYGAASAPTDHLVCDGSAVNRVTYADLFDAIGTAFGAGDGVNTFNLPDLRGRHVIGADGTPAFAATGGSANHTHAGASHGHTTTQPANHADHVVTQPSHAALSHTGASITAHTMAHSGFAVANHTVTQSSGHGTHTSDGSHTHDAHDTASSHVSGSAFYGGPTTHSSDGGHTHDAHSAHAGAALSAHTETQATTHTATHGVTEPDTHAAMTHTNAALTAHTAHANAAITAASSAATGTAEAPYLALTYAIRTAVSGQPIGALCKVGQATPPSGTLVCDGSTVSRTTYASLFAVIGTTYGAGDGSTTFALPDLRGRIARGANGDIGTSGGALDHTHAITSTHTHTTTQPDAHGAHTATQPDAHGTLTHTGAAVADHNLTHTGAAVAAHTATQADAHDAHTSAGSHNHNSHTVAGDEGTGAFVSLMTSPTAHANGGSHTHTGAHSHSGFAVNAHSLGQATAHTHTHTVTQPGTHTVSVHSGFAVDAHGAHAGFTVVAGGSGTTSAANPPYLVVRYVIQYAEDVYYLDRTGDFAAGASDLTADTYEMAWSEPSTTAPSSPVIYVLEPPA